MSTFRAPWHTLAVTEIWYCDQPGPDAIDKPCRDEDGWCTGHHEQAPGLRGEIEHDLAHPTNCASEPDLLNCLTADLVCDDETEAVPTSPGMYRVRAWKRLRGAPAEGPDSGLDCELAESGGVR